jgi:DNA-binding transcriptional LysR family regulator
MIETVTLDQLRTFLAIAETGSFSAAARRIGRAQSAVSHAIQSLEQALGVTLFDRTGRRPVMTPQGATLLADARAIIARTSEMKNRAKSLNEDLEPELSIAVEVVFPKLALMAAIGEVQREFPLLPITLYTEGMSAIESLVLDGKCAIGIGCADFTSSDRLARTHLIDIELVAVVSSGHALARRDGPVPTEELRSHTQLVLTDRSQLSEGHTEGVLSTRVWRFADLGTKHDYLRAGFGWGNMPLHLVEEDLASGVLRQIQPAEWGAMSIPVPLLLVHEPGYAPGRAARCFLEKLKESAPACESVITEMAALRAQPERNEKSWRASLSEEAGAEGVD